MTTAATQRGTISHISIAASSELSDRDHFVQRSSAAVVAAPPWWRRGVVEWCPPTDDSITPLAFLPAPEGDRWSRRLLPMADAPSVLLRDLIIGDVPDVVVAAPLSPPLFALSPMAQQLEKLDKVFCTVAADDPEPYEKAMEAARNAQRLFLATTVDVGRRLRERLRESAAQLLELHFPRCSTPRQSLELVTPPRRDPARPSDTAVAALGSSSDVTWSATAATLLQCTDSLRYVISGDLSKSVVAILLSILKDRDRWFYALCHASVTPLGGLGRDEALVHAIESVGEFVIRADYVLRASQTNTPQQEQEQRYRWALCVKNRSLAMLDLLGGPDADEERLRWRDMLCTLRSCFADMAHPDVPVTRALAKFLDEHTLFDLADRLCVVGSVISFVSSPDALAAEGALEALSMRIPSNVAGPRLPGVLKVVLVRLTDFELDARACWRAVFDVSALGEARLLRPSGEVWLYRHFARSWQLVMRGSLEALKASAVVLRPILNATDSTLLYGLPPSDVESIVLQHYAALWDTLENALDCPSGDVAVYICGEEYHSMLLRSLKSRTRSCFPCHVVVHDADPKGLALNLVEQGHRVALVCPVGVETLLLSSVGLEMAMQDVPSRQSPAHDNGQQSDGLRAHWFGLCDLWATTTLFLFAARSERFTASHFLVDDRRVDSDVDFDA